MLKNDSDTDACFMFTYHISACFQKTTDTGQVEQYHQKSWRHKEKVQGTRRKLRGQGRDLGDKEEVQGTRRRS